VRRLEPNTGGVLLLSGAGAATDEASVAALFSDEVVVTFSDEDSGVVRFERSSEEVVEYPFVSVPSAGGVSEAEVTSMTSEQ